MAEGKRGFVLYTNKKFLVDALSNEQAGILFKHIFDYVNDKFQPDEEDSIDDPVIKMAWLAFKVDLKEDLKKWKSICKRNKENIEKRWDKNNDTKNTSGKNGIPKIPNDTKNTDIDIDKDIDIEKDIDKDIKKESVKEKSTPSRFIPPTLEQITQYCIERNNLVDPDRFFNFYQSKDWMVGKNKMKDWKAAVRTWEKEAGFKTSGEDYSGYEFINGKYYYGGFECLVVPPEVKRKFEG